MRTNFSSFVVACAALCVFSASASAVLIDFEALGAANGEGFKVGTVAAGGINVTFSLNGSSQKPLLTEYGDTGPGTNNRLLGFYNGVEGRDTPASTDPDSDPKTVVGPSGRFFLTNSNRGPENLLNYLISFSAPVQNVSLLIYDYRADGNNSDGNPGVDRLELRGRLGAAAAGVDSWTVPSPRPIDGVVTRLSLAGPLDWLEVAMIGSDFGTGIDNLNFTVVPEPAPGSIALVMGLLTAAFRRRKAA